MEFGPIRPWLGGRGPAVATGFGPQVSDAAISTRSGGNGGSIGALVRLRGGLLGTVAAVAAA
eukprot:960442-Pyramimonas_sp.AAC.1